MKTKLILLSAFFVAVGLAFAISASAAIPHLMNYQGKATDKAGAPLNGTYNLTFRIYSSETGGTAKWTETQPNISISNGIFQVQLGSVTPLNLPFDEAYWISIEISTDGEMSPRTRLASVPYAYKAETFSEMPVVPFYRKGFNIECIDFNSIKITPGVMDVVGKMFTATTYSNPLQFTYPDSPANRDWVHGSNMPNSTAYVYVYNNNNQIAFKFSDESPNLSDQYGNLALKPYEYRRYPDDANGLYYRCIGQVKLDSAGANPNLVSSSEATLTSSHGSKFFTTSGTFVAPYGVTTVYITMCGGGAGGTASGDNSAAAGGGGGGSQAVLRYPYPVTPGKSYTVIIGSGGIGGLGPYGQAGADGGDSSFDTLVTSHGLANGSATVGGVNGVTSVGGNMIFKGGAAGAAAQSCGGSGGGTLLGVGGNAVYGGNGLSATIGYGGGGAGGGARGNGGNGKGGICIVEW